MSPDALTGMEPDFRFGGSETAKTNLRAALRLAELDLPAPQRRRRPGASPSTATQAAVFDYKNMMSSINYDERIPNNVNSIGAFSALEKWQPAFLDWWNSVGPQVFSNNEIFLRTAVSTEPGGWAQFGHVKMPDYRWGIFLADPEKDRRIACGDDAGKPVWNEVPGEYRNMLKRIIVVQADTEPASVEQQRWLADCAPSLMDARNLFQVNVEEGRHLWAMVYLLQAYFGRDGRDEADELLARRSETTKPRILDAFNQPCTDWLTFFSFAMFTDRDGKYQLGPGRVCLRPAEPHLPVHADRGSPPPWVSRTERVMRRAWLMKQDSNQDARAQGASTPTIQKGSTTGMATAWTCSARRSRPTPPTTSRVA